MKINVANIPENGLNLQISKSRDWLREMLPEGDEIFFSVDRIEGRCSVTKIGKTVSATGTIETEINLECCRCLKEFILPVKTEFKYTYAPVEDLSGEEDLELTGEDLGFGYYKDNVIDLDPIILEQIVLQVPMKPLCKESCKGLCTHCGINLNVESCDHHITAFENPFAVLKKLKINKRKN